MNESKIVEFGLSDVISEGTVIKNGPGNITVRLLGNYIGPSVHFNWPCDDSDFNILEQAYLLHMERYHPD